MSLVLNCIVGNLPPPIAGLDAALADVGFVETSTIFTSPSSSFDDDESEFESSSSEDESEAAFLAIFASAFFASSSEEEESSSSLESEDPAFFVRADFTGAALAAFEGPSSESESESLESGDSTLEGFVVNVASLEETFEETGGGTGFTSSSESESEDFEDGDGAFFRSEDFFFGAGLAASSSEDSDESESSSDDNGACFEGRETGLGTSLGAGFLSSLSLSSDSDVESFAGAFTSAALVFSSSSEELSLLSSEEDFLEGLD